LNRDIGQDSSVHRPAWPPLPLQLLDCVHDRPPDRRALDIACLEQLICPLGCADRRVLAVLVDEQLGGSVDIEVGDHSLVLARCAAGTAGQEACSGP
jgi:hypothetical protein